MSDGGLRQATTAVGYDVAVSGMRYIALGLLMLGGAACQTESIPEAQLPQRLEDAMCGRAAECACDAFQGYVGTESRCRQEFQETYESFLNWASYDTNTVHYDGACAARWLEALDQLGCSRFGAIDSMPELWDQVGCKIYAMDWTEPDYGFSPDGSCALSFHLLGDSCGRDEMCQNPRYAAAECVPISLGLRGDDCNAEYPDEVQQCAPGLFCSDGRCERLPETGESCAFESQCAQGLVCDAQSNTCGQGFLAGGSCGNGLQTCAVDHYCGENGECLRLPLEGEFCHLDASGPQCATALECGADLRCWPARPTYCLQLEAW